MNFPTNLGYALRALLGAPGRVPAFPGAGHHRQVARAQGGVREARLVVDGLGEWLVRQGHYGCFMVDNVVVNEDGWFNGRFMLGDSSVALIAILCIATLMIVDGWLRCSHGMSRFLAVDSFPLWLSNSPGSATQPGPGWPFASWLVMPLWAFTLRKPGGALASLKINNFTSIHGE